MKKEKSKTTIYKLLRLSLCLCMCFSLTACGDKEQPQEEDSSPLTFSMLDGSSWEHLASSSGGTWRLDIHSNGCGDIYHYDWESGERSLFCSDIPLGYSFDGKAEAVYGQCGIYAGGAYLYIFKSGSSLAFPSGNTRPTQIIRINVNNSEEQTVNNLPGDLRASLGGVITDSDGNLYMIVNYRLSDDKPVLGQKLIKYDVHSGAASHAVTEFMTFDEDVYVTLKGMYQNEKFLLEKRTYKDGVEGFTSQVEYMLFDPATGQAEETLLKTGNLSGNPLLVGDGYIYYIDADTKSIKFFSLPGGEAEEIADLNDIDTNSLILEGYHDSKFLISAYGEGIAYPDYYAVDMLGDKKPYKVAITIAGSEPEPAMIKGESDGLGVYFVTRGRGKVADTAYHVDGTPYTYDRYYIQYALVKKEDYWSKARGANGFPQDKLIFFTDRD